MSPTGTGRDRRIRPRWVAMSCALKAVGKYVPYPGVHSLIPGRSVAIVWGAGKCRGSAFRAQPRVIHPARDVRTTGDAQGVLRLVPVSLRGPWARMVSTMSEVVWRRTVRTISWNRAKEGEEGAHQVRNREGKYSHLWRCPSQDLPRTYYTCRNVGRSVNGATSAHATWSGLSWRPVAAPCCGVASEPWKAWGWW